MNSPLLATKFYFPRLRPEFVSRDRLVEKLNAGLDRRLTLVSAPAGYGKSTMLSEWIGQCGRPVAWLSLDERDNDVRRFLQYLAACVKQVLEGAGEHALKSLHAADAEDSEALLAYLINEIASNDRPLVLVLDDYHVITDSRVHDVLLFLIENQPHQMHLVIASRADPPWPFSRLRAHGDIQEVRAPDLRFSLEETSVFINERMSLGVPAEDIAALEQRVEGWAAGLHMAALSMRQREDKESFIRAFTGSHRYVMDYLAEEVLRQQSRDIQDFLLQTSLLDRLTAPLCDAVTESEGSQEVLLNLESRNLFLVGLDDGRRWFRYHHLFRDLLRSFVQQARQEEISALHLRASQWFEQHGLLADAFYHALAADDVARIVHLTDQMAVSSMDDGEMNALHTWLGHVSESTLLANPWLVVARAWTSFHRSDYPAVEADLGRLDELLSRDSMPTGIAPRIRGHMAAIRSYLVELQQDPVATIHQAEAALALLPEQDLKLRAFIEIRRANSLLGIGQLEKALEAYRIAGESARRAGDGQLGIIAFSETALVHLIQGRLREAVEHILKTQAYAQGLSRKDGRRSPAMGVLYRHMSSIKREANDLAEAAQYAEEAVRVCEEWGEREALMFALMASARVRFDQGALDAADRIFGQVLRLAGEISPNYEKHFQGLILHYRLLRGSTEGANRWLDSLVLSAADEITFDRQMDFHVWARYLLAKGQLQLALTVVDALQKVLDRAGAKMYSIRNRLLRAIILDEMKRSEGAQQEVELALKQAAGEGYIRMFLEQGDALETLLRRALAAGTEVEFACRLLSLLSDEQKEARSGWGPESDFMEPLSERENEVLRLLVTDLSAPAIARELVVSVSTVRSHIKQIYSKLDAHSRHEAITKARERRLL